MELGAIVAANIRAERARRRWKQAELAARLGVGWDQSKISDVEGGRREVRLSELPGFCRALDVPLLKLLEGTESDDRAALGI